MNSAILKIKPSDLAKPKVKLDVSRQVYDHRTQTSIGDSSIVFAITWNATQTFDHKGNPKDSDNDK